MTFKPRTRTRARRLGGLLAGTLALGLVPLASPALANHPPARDIGAPPENSACPVFPASGGNPQTTSVPEDGFTDVPNNNLHEFAIDCVAWYDVTSGKTATTYAPEGSIRRDQMATFIAQTIDYVADRTTVTTDGLPDVQSGNRFPCDVNTNNVHFDNIQRLAAAGVVRGTNTNSSGQACFDPDGTVTRAQMATFLREASAEVAGGAIADDAFDHFVDDNTSIHEDNINAVAKAGLAEGASRNTNNEDIYNPDGIVRRDQMGSFIARTLDRLVEIVNVAQNPDIQPPVAGVDPDDATVPKTTAYEGTVTGFRGNIDFVTVSGCGVPATRIPGGTASHNMPTLEIDVTIPASQGNGDCDLTVVTNFVDAKVAGSTATPPPNAFGAEDRSDTDTVTITVTPAPATTA